MITLTKFFLYLKIILFNIIFTININLLYIMTTTISDIKLPTPYKYQEKVIKKFEDLSKKGKKY